MSDARAVAEETARASYGRLLAWLSARTRDVAAAEDALADAFRAALEHWPEKGVPDAPEAWLLTAARRKLIDRSRRARTQADSAPALVLAAEEAEAAMRADETFPDERLKLLFICAHPAIDPAIRSPLMLQTVMGLDAGRIASAFLVSPAAMSGRLVRAKRKIKAARIPFEPPPAGALHSRLAAVLEAIYTAFGAGWDDPEDAGAGDLTREAIFLARLITELAPDAAEGWGLLALMLHADARKPARRENGAYVPLAEQNIERWDREKIAAAEAALTKAWRLGDAGPYQIEAAIQSAHNAGRLSGRDTREDVAMLYKKLVELSPSIGAQVGYAAALANSANTEKALTVLDGVDLTRVEKYQSYWAVRAHVLKALGFHAEAVDAYDRAIGLTEDMPTRRFLIEKKAALKN